MYAVTPHEHQIISTYQVKPSPPAEGESGHADGTHALWLFHHEPAPIEDETRRDETRSKGGWGVVCAEGIRHFPYMHARHRLHSRDQGRGEGTTENKKPKDEKEKICKAYVMVFLTVD